VQSAESAAGWECNQLFAILYKPRNSDGIRQVKKSQTKEASMAKEPAASTIWLDVSFSYPTLPGETSKTYKGEG
jgi:hypothetical protein